MNKRLKALLEERDTAQAAYEAFVNPIIEAKRELTDEEKAQRAELRGKVTELDERIEEVNTEARTEELLAEARQRAGTNVDVAVTSEPKVYGEGSPNSYFADLVRSSSIAWSGHRQAIERLSRYEFEVACEIAHDTKEGRAAARKVLEAHRTDNGIDARQALEALRRTAEAGAEQRTGMDTTANSGGSFVTPVYLVQDYAPYREAGRPFIDQCNLQDLPEYGMTIFLPHVTGPAAVAAQTENQAVTETDPQAGYLSAGLVTEAGQVIVSQQLLDRAGPNFAFDKLVFDQLTRDYNKKADVYVLTQSLANAGRVHYTAGSFAVTAANGASSFYRSVSGAKSQVRNTPGTVMNPTHFFCQADRWELISSWTDSNGRPLVVPDYAGPFNAAGGGSKDGDSGVEGATGYRFNGLPAFTDLSIPAPATGNDQAVVGALDEVYVWEGEPVPRVIPQSNAATLSVLLQLYSYLGVIPRYPSAVQAVDGTGMAAISF